MIFFSYGIPKSASSFVFQMTRIGFESLEKEGRIKLHNIGEFFPGFPDDSFFAETVLKDGFKLDETWDSEKRSVHLDRLFDPLLEKFGERRSDVILFKTHLPCSPNVADAIRRGTVLASATFRHPAEMILSLRDMAKHDGRVLTHDAKTSCLYEVKNSFHTWADLPQVRKYYFDDIVLRPRKVVGDIYRHIGSRDDYSVVLEEYLTKKKSMIWEFNKGIINRHHQEMSKEEIIDIEESFSDFIDYINKHSTMNGKSVKDC